MKEFIIKSNDSGQRLDKFMRKAAPSLPAGMLYKFLRTKKIKVNRKRAEGSQMLNENDVVSCYINDDFFSEERSTLKKIKTHSFTSALPEIDAVYEDENLLIIYKPQGLVVHDDDHKTSDTLIARVLHYLYKKGSYNPDSEQSFAPALCNRLDRNTSGLVIAAKNAASLREINRLIREDKIHKSYLCITTSSPPKKQDTLKAYHIKPQNGKTVKISSRKLGGYKEIITGYNVLSRKDNLCLVKIDLITGRTHQIRAHMAFVGAPLLGDDKYGKPDINRKYNAKYQQLCAYKLVFEPENDSFLGYLSGKRFTCELPQFVKRFFPDFRL